MESSTVQIKNYSEQFVLLGGVLPEEICSICEFKKPGRREATGPLTELILEPALPTAQYRRGVHGV